MQACFLSSYTVLLNVFEGVKSLMPRVCAVSSFCALVKRCREGVRDSAASLMVPPVVSNTMPTHHCVPDDVDPDLVFFCRHVYDSRYGRLLKNLQ